MTLGSTRGRSVPLRSERRGPLRSPACYCSAAAGRKCRVSGGGGEGGGRGRGRAVVAVRRAARRRGGGGGAAAAGGRRPGLHFFHGRREPRTSALSRIEYGVKYDGQRDRGKTTGCKKGGEGNGSRTGYRMSTLPDVLPGQSVHYIDGDEGHRRRSLASQTYSRSTGLG